MTLYGSVVNRVMTVFITTTFLTEFEHMEEPTEEAERGGPPTRLRGQGTRRRRVRNDQKVVSHYCFIFTFKYDVTKLIFTYPSQAFMSKIPLEFSLRVTPFKDAQKEIVI